MLQTKKINTNKGKPLSNKLQKILKSVKNTNECRSYAGNKPSSLGMKKLTRHASKNRFGVQEGVSAFNRYAYNLTLVNRHHFHVVQGWPMIVGQKSKLLEFLRNNRNIKFNTIRCHVFIAAFSLQEIRMNFRSISPM